MSIDFDFPMNRVRRWEPPIPAMTPRLISGWPNFAVSEAMMKSHIMAKFAAPAQRIAGHGRDDRLADAQHLLHLGAEHDRRRRHVDEGLLAHHLDVGAGGEGLVRTGDDDAAHLVVGSCAAFRRRHQLAQKLRVERVQASGRFRVMRATWSSTSTMIVS
jgi:hypothetical protein